MISSTNINGIEYRISPDEFHNLSDLPEYVRVHISNMIQQGLGKNKSADEIMDTIVLKGPDGKNYLTTGSEGLLMAIEQEVTDSIRTIMTGDKDII